MKILKSNHLPSFTILFIGVVLVWVVFNVNYWKNPKNVICWDVISYYSYLPATFIYGDVTLMNPNAKYKKYHHVFWPEKTPIGKKAIKTSMGLSILYSPFFFGAHAYASFSDHEPGGFSTPYRIALLLGSISYLLIGLLFLSKVLLLFYNKYITSIVLILVVLGTNLFFYSSFRAAMSHSFSFSAIAIYIWFSIRWHQKQTLRYSIFLGLLLGIISLIRPTNIVVLLFFAAYGVDSWGSIKERVFVIFKNYWHVIIMMLFFLLVWSPQLLYWKEVSGSWFFYSYGEERFFFDNPKIIPGLFSYRNGWLLYTPMMVLALLGIPLLFKNRKKLLVPIILFLIVNMYIVLSWWCWWYTGYSNRAMIDSYGLLAIPLAEFVYFVTRKRLYLKISIFVVVFALLCLSLFQTWQFHSGMIHYNGMTKKSYWMNFGRTSKHKDYWHNIVPPEREKAMRGEVY